jgi:catechol 2,3-dioxygenase-like lactoylglutathione lyase family enzyme
VANIDHVAIQAENIDECVDWYIKNFSPEIIYRDDTWAMLGLGGTKLAITKPSQHPAHIAIEVNSIDEFPCAINEISEHRDGSKYLYVKDPSGNVVEYIWYPSEQEDYYSIHLP